MNRRFFLLATTAGLAETAAPGQVFGPPPAPVTTSGDPNFDAWSASFAAQAIAAGLPEAVVRQEMAGLTPDPKVVSLDGRQPELSRPIGDYMRSAVSDAKIAKGRSKLQELAAPLSAAQRRTGVDGELLVGIWGMESDYGLVQGEMDVVRCLATLAYDGRRRAWAEEQLIAALRILSSGEATRAQMKGSWAGAMGQTQFLPGTYLSTAVDGDGDGRRDIWGSPADALASAGALLAKGGWRTGESWAVEMTLPAAFDHSLTEGPKSPPAWWAAQGLRRADGRPWSAADAQSQAMLLLPAGYTGPAFLAFPNHYAIRTYNNSTSYALAVGLIADRVAGAPPLTRAWPSEPPIPRADREGAQRALTALGFDTKGADGAIGANTRAAMRGWQKSRGLPADGYLTLDLAKRVQAEAAGVAAAGATTVPPSQ